MNASETIDDYIAQQDAWQSKQLTEFRKLVLSNDGVSETWKWNVPVFTSNGKMLCAMSTFKDHIKFNFFDGASLIDECGLFNSGLDSKNHRSINTTIGGSLDWSKLTLLITKAIAHTKDA